MDTLNHFTLSALETVVPLTVMGVPQEIVIPCGILAGISGALPDIVGEYYAIVKKDGYKMYKKIHDNNHWLIYNPFSYQHVWIDSYCHTVGKRWYMNKWYEYFIPSRWLERSWIESCGWLINILLIIVYLLIR